MKFYNKYNSMSQYLDDLLTVLVIALSTCLINLSKWTAIQKANTSYTETPFPALNLVNTVT